MQRATAPPRARLGAGNAAEQQETPSSADRSERLLKQLRRHVGSRPSAQLVARRALKEHFIALSSNIRDALDKLPSPMALDAPPPESNGLGRELGGTDDGAAHRLSCEGGGEALAGERARKVVSSVARRLVAIPDVPRSTRIGVTALALAEALPCVTSADEVRDLLLGARDEWGNRLGVARMKAAAAQVSSQAVVLVVCLPTTALPPPPPIPD